MGAAVRGFAAAGVVALCALPSAALNVWPKLPQLYAGTAAGSDVAFVIMVTVSVLLMAAVPFAVSKARNIGWKSLFWAAGIALATLNYTLAVASVGKMRDSDAGPLRELVHKHAGLDSRIERARNSRKQLPQQRPLVDQAMLDAANETVRLADEARKQECGKVGENCRARVADLTKATEARAPLLAHKASADQIDAADKTLKALEDEKAALAPAPQNVDAAAYRLSKQLGKIVDLGDNPVDATADILIYTVSGFAEFIALLGPMIFLTAMMGRTDKPAAPAGRRWWQWHRKRARIEAPTTTAAPQAAAPALTPATPAKAKSPKKIKAAGVREFGDVQEWKDSRTIARPSSRVKPGDAYAAYKAWCLETDKEAVSLTAFGTTMKGELGVLYEERSKRGFYVGIALVGAPKLVASAIDDPHARRALGSMVSVHN
jgi:hypothetical protein